MNVASGVQVLRLQILSVLLNSTMGLLIKQPLSIELKDDKVKELLGDVSCLGEKGFSRARLENKEPRHHH